MEHTPESLEHYSAEQQADKEKETYTQRPKSHVFIAWVLIGIVLFAFLGTCYWLANYGKV